MLVETWTGVIEKVDRCLLNISRQKERNC